MQIKISDKVILETITMIIQNEIHHQWRPSTLKAANVPPASAMAKTLFEDEKVQYKLIKSITACINDCDRLYDWVCDCDIPLIVRTAEKCAEIAEAEQIQQNALSESTQKEQRIAASIAFLKKQGYHVKSAAKAD
jgi:hypothetical protein